MTEQSALKLARRAGEYALDKKANEGKIFDLRGITSITDYFVICSGDADIQVKAIAKSIVEGLKQEDFDIWHMEGFETGRWILLDYVDVVVHVFLEEAREFYGLERLWGDAPTENME